MDTTRTFVAIALPEAWTPKIVRLQSLIAQEIAGVRWATVSPFHVTLAFLGDVENIRLNDVCRAVGEAASAIPAFDLRLEGLGVFPNPSSPRVFWAGLRGEGLPILSELQTAIDGRLGSLGYGPDELEFRPHVTLGRCPQGRRPTADVSPLLNHYRTWSAGSFHVTEAITFASALSATGPEYAVMARAPLLGKKAGKND
jgi:2'-5' RNA ligase